MIKEIIRRKLTVLYMGESGVTIGRVGELIGPDVGKIVSDFYEELKGIPEIRPLLENAIVEKNLPSALKNWFETVFRHTDEEGVLGLVGRHTEIGRIHADISVNLNFFNLGLGILKRELFSRIRESGWDSREMADAFCATADLLDILGSIVAENYFSREMTHEQNQLALKIKAAPQNMAMECERLRNHLLEWMKSALTLLYQNPSVDPSSLPKLHYSNFGLWVIYKAEFLLPSLKLAEELGGHIREIDDLFFTAAKFKAVGDEAGFFRAMRELDEKVTKTSWRLSTIADHAMELDSGMDSLTRLFNRRYLDTILRRQNDISTRQGMPYAVLMLDIDNFKRFNDRYGHDAGDAILKQFSEALLMNVRTSDFVFRFGGEEFLVILGGTDEQKALAVAEKVRATIEDAVFRLPDKRKVRITCSIGVALHDGHPDYRRVLKRADQALYVAKNEGRNRCRMS